MTLAEIAAEIDRTPGATKKLIAKQRWLGFTTRTQGRTTLYDASTVEVLKGVLGIPHRPVVPPGQDWLTQWIGESR